MLSTENLASIQTDGRELGRLVRSNPGTPVPQYPGWLMSDLAQHVAWAHGRVVTICREMPTDRIKGPRLPQDTDPADWYDRTLEDLIGALAAAEPQTAVWGLTDMATIGFWERRMVIETAVHLWDARQAVGEPASLSDHAATAGLDEYLERLPLLGGLPPIEVVATDIGRGWLYGVGEPVAVISGSASDIFLRLYSRASPAVLPEEWAKALDALPAPPKP